MPSLNTEETIKRAIAEQDKIIENARKSILRLRYEQRQMPFVFMGGIIKVLLSRLTNLKE